VRKQTDEERILDETVGRFDLAVINIDDLDNFLKRVEGDARRQNDLEK
jgi:hypothetical protein